MAFIKVGIHLINEEDITAISPPFYGSNEYQIRLRGSELMRVTASNDEYCVTKLMQKLTPKSNLAEQETEQKETETKETEMPDSIFVLAQENPFSRVGRRDYCAV